MSVTAQGNELELRTKRSTFTLVKVDVVSFLGNNDIPRVYASGGSHQNRQDGIRGVHLSFILLRKLRGTRSITSAQLDFARCLPR